VLSASYSYSLPVATNSALGGVIVPTSGKLTVDGSGNLSLATIAAGHLLANSSGSAAVPTDTSLTALWDAVFGSTQGQIVYRGVSGWAALGPGSSGQYLQTQGSGANPQWAAVAGASGGTITGVTAGTGLSGGGTSGTVTLSLAAQPYIISGFYPGVPGNSQLLLVHRCGTAITFPANFATTASGADTGGGCTVNATGSTVINIDKCLAANDPTTGGNWTTIGTLTIGAGGHSFSLATTGGASQSAAKGDFIRAVAPATADATAANIYITLAADR
jgi:hypothetical protein